MPGFNSQVDAGASSASKGPRQSTLMQSLFQGITQEVHNEEEKAAEA
jgi:hypothetical protein